MSKYAKAIYAVISTGIAGLAIAAESNGISLSEALSCAGAALAVGGGVLGITNSTEGA